MDSWRTRDTLAQVGSGTVANAAVAAVGYISPLAGLLLTVGQPVFAAALESLARRGLDRVSEVASDDSRLTAEELAARLTATDDGIRLLARALESAQTAAHDEKLRALGRCLAAGAQDGSRIDTELLLVAAVTALEPVHLRLLRVLACEHVRTVAEGLPNDHVATWTITELSQDDDGLIPEVVEALVGHLVAQGVTTTVSGSGVFSSGTVEYRASWLGHLLLERARAADTTATKNGSAECG